MANEVPDYSQEQIQEDPSSLEKLRKLMLEMLKLQLAKEDLEEALKKKEEELKQYQFNLVPELMSELDVTEITLKGGTKVELKEEIRASLPKDPQKRSEAFQYLEDTGNSGLIKHEFTISFGRDQADEAQRFECLLEDNSLLLAQAGVSHEETINHQSMLKFLRDQRRAGEEVPMTVFGAFIQKFAKIKL